MGLGDGDRRTDRLSRRFDCGRSEFGSNTGSVLRGEIPLILEKVDVGPGLGNEVGSEG